MSVNHEGRWYQLIRLGARGRAFDGLALLPRRNGVGSPRSKTAMGGARISETSDSGSDELRGVAVQQATKVIGLLIKAFCVDLVARRFGAPRQGQGAGMARLKVGTRFLRRNPPEVSRPPTMIEVHGVLLSP
jgi:hypothetical protein